jgi:hypothetical protein
LMDMSREQRLADLENAFSQVQVSPVESAEELARSEMARAARHFGFAQPVFRTSIRLHFSGDGVRDHDLSSGLAGSVIAGFSGAVSAAASQLKIPPGSSELYLSPVVAAGSTVLELFGAPLPPADKLDTEIDDTPVDKALAHLFVILNDANKATQGLSHMAPVEGVLGKRLFQLVTNLIENSVDLGVSWTRPRGRTISTSLRRSASLTLQRVLDTETVESSERRESGILATISTAGVIGFTIDGRRSVISIAAPGYDAESLRDLWAKRVEMTWRETIISHPQREEKKITHELISVRALKEA